MQNCSDCTFYLPSNPAPDVGTRTVKINCSIHFYMVDL
jgi:hypothetical protein